MVNLKFLFVSVTGSVVIIDQLVKLLIEQYTPFWQVGVLNIQHITNTGAGFGILQNQAFFLGLLSVLIAGILLWNYKKIEEKVVVQALWGLFLGGLLGNLIDRLLRGHVIDFINFSFWPAFNIADMCISVAAIGLVIVYWKK